MCILHLQKEAITLYLSGQEYGLWSLPTAGLAPFCAPLRVSLTRLCHLGREGLAAAAKLHKVALRMRLDGISVPAGHQSSACLPVSAMQLQGLEKAELLDVRPGPACDPGLARITPLPPAL